MKSKLVIFLFVVAFCINLVAFKAYRYIIHWDKAGYYLYLPAIFVNHDLAQLAFYEHVDAEYQPTGDWKWYCIFKDSATGKRYNKYPMGVAILEAPFFFAAQAYTAITDTPPLYGYSNPYQVAVCVATMFWAVLGLLYLRKLLLRYFNDQVVAISLLLIAFGTNLWHYSIFDMGMSHPFSFGLYCLLLYLTDSWYAYKKGGYAVTLSIVMGLIIITRPSNAIAILIPLLWGCKDIGGFGSRFTFFKNQYKPILLGILSAFAILMLQFAYWHYTTSHWVIYSYKGEKGFDFLHPHIWDGLTSYNKGWFVYTPVALLFIPGFVLLYRQHKQLCIALLLFSGLNIYIVFSWSFWQYGGGFSARALIESYAMLAIPLAAFIQWLVRRGAITKIVSGTLFVLFIALNTFQTWQVENRILPGIWISKQEYWKDFGRVRPGG